MITRKAENCDALQLEAMHPASRSRLQSQGPQCTSYIPHSSKIEQSTPELLTFSEFFPPV